MKLSIVKSDLFGTAQCDFWENQSGDVFMTITQLSSALEYASKAGVENIVSRNPYLKDVEFSTTHKMRVLEGKRNVMREQRIFNEDGIYEVTMLSDAPKAKEFRRFVRKTMKGLRKGSLTLVSSDKQQDLEIRRMNAEARLLNAKTRQAMLVLKSKDGKTLHPKSVELLEVNAMELLTGDAIQYRPEVSGAHYSAEDIAKEAGVSKNKVGRVANAHSVKTDEYGMMVLDKSRYSDKQIEVFRYNEQGKRRMLDLLKGASGE